jgi:hypothetical protein
MRRSNVAVAAAGVAFAAGMTVALLTTHGDRPIDVISATTTSSGPSATTVTTTGVTTTTRPPASTTTTTVTAPSPSASGGLRAGAVGPDVAGLEQQLTRLGFWLGTPDNRFDSGTAHAVVAFQKLAGLPPDGVVGDRTVAALASATPPTPRSPTGHLLEIDLTHQVLIVAHDGATRAVLDISSGRVAGTTPIGRFVITRQIEGYHRAPLGVLYRPKYFFEGVAVHGYPTVPPYPASHGCVRTTNAGMDWLWSSGVAPIGTAVWVYR